MTAQIAERLKFLGEDVAMCTNPLSSYFAMGGTSPRFQFSCTALWRGYIGTWEIVSDRLYLIGLDGTLEGGTDATLATIFPGFPDRVFAHWYSGAIRVPRGKQLEYVHGGYSSTFERDLFLDVGQGVLRGTWERTNGVSKSENAPDRYEVGAMTVFPRPRNGAGGAT